MGVFASLVLGAPIFPIKLAGQMAYLSADQRLLLGEGKIHRPTPSGRGLGSAAVMRTGSCTGVYYRYRAAWGSRGKRAAREQRAYGTALAPRALQGPEMARGVNMCRQRQVLSLIDAFDDQFLPLTLNSLNKSQAPIARG